MNSLSTVCDLLWAVANGWKKIQVNAVHLADCQ